MMLVVDESIDAPIFEQLQQDGHSVFYAAEMAAGGADDEVLSEANRQNALLVTADKDFGELVFRMGRVHHGVVLIRLAGLSATVKCQLTSTAIRDHGDQMAGAFSVISPGLLRIRTTP